MRVPKCAAQRRISALGSVDMADRIKRSEHKARTRERLISAAMQALVAGAERMTTGRIAEAAGLSQSSFYVHFTDVPGLLDIVAERGVRVSHMPLSNCEVGGGIAPMTDLLARGTTIGLGSDGYVNDMFEVMRGAFLLHKARLLDPGAMPANDVFHMATAGAAAALGIDDIGSIVVGNFADFQLVDATFATPVQPHNLLDQLVLWRNQTHVSDVMVNGEWRVRDHEVLDADVDRLRAAMHEQALRLWDGT